ncbi:MULTISPECIES: hypothetical protein [unclassified Hydrogenophaga]|uniref:hypothetical protein n=1 Tax=unclassified Hydrogenophaga TaxID=2610897 RepID=UPI000878B972|nr:MULTISPECIES: hypothetical protein [unclassified Hydrogenophaga]MBN9372479.1 hypothetical protein [Hydrogenophaga sp.]OJV37681.1 MAG: hypothetical protein BGO22_08465 [Hydrogenophaga sp. 70-12]
MKPHRAAPILAAALLALSFTAGAQTPGNQGKLDFQPPDLPAELKGLKSLQQIGGACDMLFNRTTKSLSQEYFKSTDSARAGTVFGWMRDLSARRHALDTAGLTGMGIVPADIPVIQQAFRAPNMSPAGMERAFKFCDELGDSVTAAVKQALDASGWADYQAQVSRRTLKALMDHAPAEKKNN